MLDLRSIPHKFTANQFVALQNYVKNGGNKTAAYRAAYNPSTVGAATASAYQLFNQWYMVAAVKLIDEAAMELLNQKLNDMVIDKAWVLHRAALLANFNIKKFIVVDELGNAVYDFKNATDDDWYCISEYTVDEISSGERDKTYQVERVKLKTVDKLRALELVGKHVDVQAWKEQVETTGTTTQVIMGADEYKKARAEVLAKDDC